MFVIAFDSTHAAMAAQTLLKGLRFDVIPTPTDITAECGMSLRMEDDLMEQAMRLLQVQPEVFDKATWHYL